MLQNVEYQPGPYLAWFWRVQNYSTVMKRRTLIKTKAARLLLLALQLGILLQITVALAFIVLEYSNDFVGGYLIGSALLLAYPVVWAHLIVLPLVFGRLFIVLPRQRKLIQASKTIFAAHPGIVIGIAGSYGKTTMKELLGAVLSKGKTVAITPANKNVAISHAYFARKLTGKEDILVIEYGEGRPGDVARFAATTQPDIGIITGLAPAHLDQYASTHDAGLDIFSLADHLKEKQVFVNSEGAAIQPFLKEHYQVYNQHGVAGWKVSDIHVTLEGTSFTMKKGTQTLKLNSGLLGRHQVGPLALVAALAAELGLSSKQIIRGISLTKPFEHRMQPRQLHGAWIIDDTYNGNLEGIKAGLQLLSSVSAKRKLYVTPGLVDQGAETEEVHRTMGQYIAEAKPDKVVLMENSVTEFIRAGLTQHGFKGEVVVQTNPLRFYTNLEHFVAAGDVVLMQNDWTDNYK